MAEWVCPFKRFKGSHINVLINWLLCCSISQLCSTCRQESIVEEMQQQNHRATQPELAPRSGKTCVQRAFSGSAAEATGRAHPSAPLVPWFQRQSLGRNCHKKGCQTGHTKLIYKIKGYKSKRRLSLETHCACNLHAFFLPFAFALQTKKPDHML